MQASRKPLLFSILCLAVVLGFGFDVLNSRRAHENRADLVVAPSQKDTPPLPQSLDSRARAPESWDSPGAPLDPGFRIDGAPESGASSLRFDPDGDDTVVLELGGYHPPPDRGRTPRPSTRAPARDEDRSRTRRSRPVESPTRTPRSDVDSNPDAAPGSPAAGQHTVKKGESLSTLAARYLGDARHWRRIAEFNGIEQPHLVREGARIRIPPRPSAPSTGVKKPAATTRRTCTVRANDTLTRIAARELGDADRWREIAALNDIRDPRSIRKGQQLRLP